MIKSVSKLYPCIKITENRNEYSLTFSHGTDLTPMMEVNEYLRNHKEYINRFGVTNIGDEVNDMPVSFKNADGVVDWDKLNEYVNMKESSYQKAKSSIYRAKSTIYDLIQSNYWDYFVTITVNPNSEYMKEVDIKNVYEVQRSLQKLIKNANRWSDTKMKYVFIPEYQENGNVHFHGVVSGIREDDLEIAINNQEYRKDEKGEIMVDRNGNPVPNEYYKQPLIRKGNQVYNHRLFNKIGYNDFEIIRDMSRVGSYCTKYITKDLLERSNEYGAHLYFCSKGLERKKTIYKREVEEYKPMTDEEIKKGIDENAYIIRTDYTTKVIINKKHVKDKDVLIRFADAINSNTIKHDVYVGYCDSLLKGLTKNQLEDVGIKRYDADTGEIEFTKVKTSFAERDKNGVIVERRNVSFRQMADRLADKDRIKSEQLRL